MRKDLIKLLEISDVEQRICSVLMSRGYIRVINKEKGLMYSNISLTTKAKNLVNKPLDIPEGFIKKYRYLFPAGKKSTPSEVLEKMSTIFKEYSYISNLEDTVISATERYLNTVTDVTYCEKAGNFINKQLKGNCNRSTLREYMEMIIEEAEELQNDLENSTTFGNELL